jgi:glycosyltransferase involved in cell wall biosynthesis
MTNVVESESRYFSGDVFRFLGKVEESDYIEILRQSHVGLCLKLPGSGMGATTFPSKVVEFASYGLLVISTRVSDVPDLFPPGSAVLLADPSAEALVAALVAADADPQTAREIAERGNAVVRERLSVKKVGTELLAFLGGVPGDKPRC